MTYKSELKQKSSKNSSQQYHDLFMGSPIAMGAVQNEIIRFINASGARLLGAESPEQLINHSLLDFIHADQRDFIKKTFFEIENKIKTDVPVEIKLVRPDNSVIDVEMSTTPLILENIPAIQFSFYEISVRKEMEELIFQSRQDWEDTFHTITDMITIHDKDFNIIYANKAAQEMLKIPSFDSSIRNKCFKYYHGTACPPDGCPSCGCLTTGKSANFEIFEPHLNMFIEIRSMPRFDKNNNLIGLIHISRDVSERKRAEKDIQKAKDELEQRVEERTSELSIINEQLKDEITERKLAVNALRTSENEYKNLSQEFNTLLDGIPDNLILLSPDLKIMWANKTASAFIKKDGAEIKGQYCYGLCCNILSPCENCPTLRSFTSGKEETAEVSTSEDKIWDIRSFPIIDDTGKVKSVMELARDITEKVNLQAGATRTRHLASLGELAAGVAHEINNPINNVINYAQILVDEFTEENRDLEIPERIMKDGDRIATIVRSLLSFARIRKEEKSIIYLQDLFSDTLSLTAAQIRKDGIFLKVNIPSKFLKVPVHPQQIQQVFLNMISNSRFALNQKYPGTDENKILEIKCEEVTLNNRQYVKIVFHDTGTGIPSNIIDKVINPFFSTKPNQIGTGLGLSISHGILNEHGGKLTITSVEGEFTKIVINLPTSMESDK
jgi:PAS domain S-box-containing protein